MHHQELGAQVSRACTPSSETPPTAGVCSENAGSEAAEAAVKTLEVHDIANLFPPMRETEFEALVADIQEHGQFEPIWTHQGKIIDGRNRFRACRQLGMTPGTQEWDGEGSLLEFVIALNLHRRHLKETQRAMIAARMLPKFEEEAEQRSKAGKQIDPGNEDQTCHSDPCANWHRGRATNVAGKALNVSWRSVERARKVLEKGCPALIDAVERCKVAVSTAAALAEHPREEQEELLKLGRKALAEALHPKPACSDQPGGKVEAAGAAGPAKMPQAPPLSDAIGRVGGSGASAQATPEQQQRDAILLQCFSAGCASLTKNELGMRLEFSHHNCLDELCMAVRDKEHFLELLNRGVFVMRRKPA